MSNIILEKNKIIDDMIKIYESIDKSNQYESELKIIDKQLNLVENKKNMTLDLVFSGEIKKEQLKVQFKKFENEIKLLNNEKEELLKQLGILRNNEKNIGNISKFIQEELEGECIEEFIRKFVDEIIVYKIDEDRYNIKLDIYLNLVGNELLKLKGAKNINSKLKENILYLSNQEYFSIESQRKGIKRNKFVYNVYIEKT